MNDETTPSSISGNRVLITGGAGFIGSRLVTALASDNDVRVLDNLSNGSRSNVPNDVTLIQGDLRNEKAVEQATDGVDIIFHHAALIDVERSVRRPALTHEINVTGTVTLLEQARKESATVVFASSAAVYGHPSSVPIAEDASMEPTSPYGLSKLAAEQYVNLYGELYDITTVSLRYFNVYGAGQLSGPYSAVISIFVEQALSGDPITVEGDGSQTRDFVHIDDVVNANLLAASSGVTGVFNIGTSESVSILELAETIRDVVGSDSEIVHVDERPGDIARSRADISQAKSVLGFTPSVSLHDGIESFATETAIGDDG